MLIFIADDHPGVRYALRLSLLQTGQVDSVAEAADALGLLGGLGEQSPDLLLLDWGLPGLPPAQLLRLIQGERPTLPILVLVSGFEQEQEALQHGIVHVAHQGAPSEALMRQIAGLLNMPLPDSRCK